MVKPISISGFINGLFGLNVVTSVTELSVVCFGWTVLSSSWFKVFALLMPVCTNSFRSFILSSISCSSFSLVSLTFSSSTIVHIRCAELYGISIFLCRGWLDAMSRY